MWDRVNGTTFLHSTIVMCRMSRKYHIFLFVNDPRLKSKAAIKRDEVNFYVILNRSCESSRGFSLLWEALGYRVEPVLFCPALPALSYSGKIPLCG